MWKTFLGEILSVISIRILKSCFRKMSKSLWRALCRRIQFSKKFWTCCCCCWCVVVSVLLLLYLMCCYCGWCVVIVSVLLLHNTKYIFTNAEFSFNSNDIEEDGFILADAMTGTFVELLWTHFDCHITKYGGMADS